jgi:hypothetical protein
MSRLQDCNVSSQSNSFTAFHFPDSNPYTTHDLKFTLVCCYVRWGGDDGLLISAEERKQLEGAPLVVVASLCRATPAAEGHFHASYLKFLIANAESENDSTR